MRHGISRLPLFADFIKAMTRHKIHQNIWYTHPRQGLFWKTRLEANTDNQDRCNYQVCYI